MQHTLKTTFEAWEAVNSGKKRFEVRRNDRLFQTGDMVVLRQLEQGGGGYANDPEGGRFSTRDLTFRIGWILQGGQFGIEPGYCVFQLEPLSTKDTGQ